MVLNRLFFQSLWASIPAACDRGRIVLHLTAAGVNLNNKCWTTDWGGIFRQEGPLSSCSSYQSLSCAAPCLPALIEITKCTIASPDPGIFSHKCATKNDKEDNLQLAVSWTKPLNKSLTDCITAPLDTGHNKQLVTGKVMANSKQC